ncbi:MAG: ATP-binding protein [Deltaproteobacteria bacterium]|nr:ATP-binding protein [Deltaproteobacteria bacterium]
MLKLTVYKKIIFGFGAIMFIMIISSSFVLFELNTVSKGAKNILISNVWLQEWATQLQDLIQNENEYLKKYLVSKDETYLSLLNETGRQIDLNFKISLDRKSSMEDHSLMLNMLNAHNVIIKKMKDKNFDSPSDYARVIDENVKILLDSLDIMIRENHTFIGKEIGRIEFITVRAVQVAFLLMAGTLIVAITAALIITQTITRPIGELIKGTEQIAKGKFEKINVSSNDEITLLADAVNDMSAKIKSTNKLKAETMHQISHELRNPLQVMQSAHDILKISKAVRQDKIKTLAIIDTGIGRIADFSQQYLDLEKIESGAMQYNMELTDLIKIIEPIVEETKIVADAKNIYMSLDSVTVPNVMADAQKVSIVIYNLINNAVKYTPEDGEIKISIMPCKLGVQVEVLDSGIGIDQDEINNIFTRFYQARNIKKIKSSGSGVGLAMVKAYVEGHGGRIYVESSPDHGSSFKVEFPAGKEKPVNTPGDPAV